MTKLNASYGLSMALKFGFTSHGFKIPHFENVFADRRDSFSLVAIADGSFLR